jgi:proteic killer suppression protein
VLVDFEDEGLRRLHEELDFRLPQFGDDLTRHFRKVMGAIMAAVSEQDLYAMRSLKFEKLQGKRKGQHSLRLNQQWRLIVRLTHQDTGKVVMVVEVVDYH